MPSNNEPTKTSVPPSPTSSEEEEREARVDRICAALKRIQPNVIAKPKPKKPIPRHVN